MKTLRTARGAIAAALALLFLVALAGSSLAAGKSSIPAVRAATNKYKDLNVALADSYIEFYKCTSRRVSARWAALREPRPGPRSGGRPLRRVLVYAPKRNGSTSLCRSSTSPSHRPPVSSRDEPVVAATAIASIPSSQARLTAGHPPAVRRLEPFDHLPREGDTAADALRSRSAAPRPGRRRARPIALTSRRRSMLVRTWRVGAA